MKPVCFPKHTAQLGRDGIEPSCARFQRAVLTTITTAPNEKPAVEISTAGLEKQEQLKPQIFDARRHNRKTGLQTNGASAET